MSCGVVILRWRQIEAGEKDRFDQFIASSDAGDILQSFAWGEVKELDWQPIRCLAEDDSGEIRAAATVLVRRLPFVGRTVAYVPRGPVLDYSDTDLLVFVLRSLARLAREKKAIFLKIDPGVPDGSPLAKTLTSLGFSRPSGVGDFGGLQPRYTFILDLSGSITDVYTRFSPKLRYKINYAHKKGLIFRANEETSLADFYSVLTKSGERNRLLTRSPVYFQHLYETLKKEDRVLLLTGYLSGEPVVASLTLAFGQKAWAAYGAQAGGYPNLYAYQSMNWERLCWAHGRGVRWFDLNGVPGQAAESHPLHGIYHFKKSFGGQFTTFTGEWNLPLSRPFYQLFETALPRYKQALRFCRSLVRK